MLEGLSWQGYFFLTCWCIILVRGLQLGVLRLYYVFYFYVVVRIAALMASLFGARFWGLADAHYQQLYMMNSVATQLSTIFLLLWLLTFSESLRPSREILVVTILLLVSTALELMISTGGHFIWRLNRSGSFFLLFLAVYVAIRSSQAIDFRMGRNMGFVLGGTTFLLFMQGINTTLYLTSHWAYDNFGNLYEVAGVCSWGAITWAMLDADPPTKMG